MLSRPCSLTHTIPPGHERYSKWTPQLGYIQRLQTESRRRGWHLENCWGRNQEVWGVFHLSRFLRQTVERTRMPFINQHTRARSTLTHRIPPETIDSECWKYIIKQLSVLTRFGWWRASSSWPRAFALFQIEICMYRLMELVKERNTGLEFMFL